MNRFVLALVASAYAFGGAVAADAKDTSAAAFTRTKKLKGKVTLDAKNESYVDIIKEISSQLEDAKLGPLSLDFAVGVSKNTKTTFQCDKLPADEALDGLLKTLEMGYVIISKDKDRYDGWLKLVKGVNRGYETGMEPKDGPKPETKPEPKPEPKPVIKPETKPDPKLEKPTELEEKAAAARLITAKELIEKGKDAEAKPLLKYLTKYCVGTKAAAEAKELMDKMK